jgi:hypothetical protein
VVVGSFDQFAVDKRAPARTSATRCGAFTARQRSCADSMSLNAIASPAAREPGPLVTLVRCRTVAKVDSIGLVPGMKVGGCLALSVWLAGQVVWSYGVTVRDRGILGERAWAGRWCTVGCEPALVVGRPCDSPGCAVSANP